MANSRGTAAGRRDSDLTQGSGVVRIRLLGRFEVTVGSRIILESEWRLRKAASLVKLLALAPDHRLHREQVLDLLWPDLGSKAAANNLHHALHIARRTLEPEAPAPSYLCRQGEQIALCPDGSLWIDVEAFESAAAEARRVRDIAAYRAALDLYAGDLLPGDRYEDWTEGSRQELRRTHLTLLFELAALHERRGEHGQAIEALLKLVSSEPTHEEAHFALMRLYARTGQRYQALRQYEQLREILRRERGTEPDALTQRTYEEIVAGHVQIGEPVPSGSLPAEPPEAGRHNLSGSLTSFVGREREKEEVRRLLGTARLLTLTGTGGSGKTRLVREVAREVARDLAGLYPDGAWFVELAPLSDPDLIPQAIAEVLEVRERPEQPLTETLVETLREKRLLLVLDNCEHLVEAAAHLSETLLRSCPHLKILATSREVLGTPGEVTWLTPSLSGPDPSRRPTVEELEGYESVRLFVERARYRNPTFVLTPQNAVAVAEICERLDGIPLAVELAAARVGLSVDQIAGRLDDSLKLLTTGSRTVTPRQRTLRGTVDWSYELLDEPERKLFGRLSVFAGGWTLEAAEAVGAGGRIEQDDVLDLLSRLVDKSLVVAEATGDGGVRYRLLEPIRQYARERLEQSGESEAVRRRHAAFFLALAEEAEPGLQRSQQVTWLKRLETEHPNLRVALAWSLDGGEPETGLRLAGALWRFWDTHGHLSEGRRWLETALARCEAPPASARTKALRGAGALAWAQGDLNRAEQCFEECLAVHRRRGDRRGLAASLNGLGNVVQHRGEYARAKALFEESLSLCRELADGEGVGRALINLGTTEFYQDDYSRAASFWQESLALYRQIGDKDGIAISLHNLAEVARMQDDYAWAAELGKESIVLFREMEDRWAILQTLVGLGRLAVARGHNERAARLLGAAESMREATGSALPPPIREAHDQNVATIRSALGEETFTALWTQGRAMSFEEAVEFALAEEPASTPPGDELSSVLTRREREVAALIARGLTNRKIARELTLSERTVDTHVRNILKKLGVGSREQVASRLAEQQPLAPDR
jgi:predicted ATPase/DNA-binding SARP family transcriptional activator/DNA-binding CsgD family transcriptional regulator